MNNNEVQKRLFTSESVTEGHPDKVCDNIADAVLDAMLRNDPNSRVACECCATTGMVMVMGEVTTNCYIDIPKLVRDVVLEIGYDKPEYGFDGHTLAVISAINGQSPDIAMGVDTSLETKNGEVDPLDQIGAGDQGLMFGYAIDETPEFMPLPIALSHRLMRKTAEVRKSGELPYLGPDSKAQVTVEYDEDNKPLRVDTVVLSTQHLEDVSLDQIRKDIKEHVINKVIPEDLLDDKTKYFINPTGRFVIGGPQGDAGLTGRKIIVDTYGGFAHHGGGAFSGKDATKVDRSASYAARYIAKNIVAAKIAPQVEVQLAYAIGVAQPVSVSVNTFGKCSVNDDELIKAIRKCFDLRPAGIIEMLDLRRPIYKQTAAYGHFGRTDIDLPWEHLDKVDELKAALNLK